MRWALLLVLVLVGCGAEQSCPREYYSRAEVERAWSLLPSIGACPCVVWKVPEELDCRRFGPEAADWREVGRGRGTGWIAGDTSLGRTCVVGLSDVQEGVTWAIQPLDIAHEFVHHWLYRRTGDGDGHHTSTLWNGGEALDSAAAAVRAAGVQAPQNGIQAQLDSP